MPIATKNGSIIVKDGAVAENCDCCDPCGDRPPFVRLEHSIPSSDGGGNWFETLSYCMKSVPPVLAVGNLVDQQGGDATLLIPCCYFGEINGCSLPSRANDGRLSGVRKVIVDVDQRRLFIWYAAGVSFGTFYGFTQKSLLHAVADECDATASPGQLVGSFTTVAVDPILNQPCLVQAGQAIAVYADGGPASPSYRDGGIRPVYMDSRGMWWPGSEIIVRVDGTFPGPGLAGVGALSPGDYVLSHSGTTGSQCEPGYSLNVNGWNISASMRSRTTDPSPGGGYFACSGCSHSWDVVVNNNKTYLVQYYGTQCVGDWGSECSVGNASVIWLGVGQKPTPEEVPSVTVYG